MKKPNIDINPEKLSIKELEDFMERVVRLMQVIKFSLSLTCFLFFLAGGILFLVINMEIPWKVAAIIPVLFILFSYKEILPKLKENLVRASWIFLILSQEKQKRKSEGKEQ